MKRLFAIVLLAVTSAAFSATLSPITLLNPAGSTSGQTIVSTGPTTAPAWANVTATALGAQPANTVVANATASSAKPTAFSMPSCSGAANALTYTSGTGFTCSSAVNAASLGGATFASPGAIGGTTPAAGTFTTLKASNSKAIAQTAAAQSIPTSTITVLTGWSLTLNQGGNFNASTGIYTAPVTGTYDVRCGVTFAAASSVATAQFLMIVRVNGVSVYSTGTVHQVSGASIITPLSGAFRVSASAGDQIAIAIFQSTGGARSLDATAGDNWISVEQEP